MEVFKLLEANLFVEKVGTPEQIEDLKSQALWHRENEPNMMAFSNNGCWRSEFKYKNQSTDNYLNYWNFTNIKLLSLLKNLTRENKYRIILTGDHGYRGDKKIDPHNTFTAFYGFEKADIEQIKSVQDLGSLINHYF